ncbi:glycosyltransferase [Bacteroidota bacterium]
MILTFSRGWNNIPYFEKTNIQNKQYFTVIVPARNEEKCIGFLLNDLKAQKYSSDFFEVLMVDDHSNDCTAEIMKNFCKENINFFYIKSGNNEHGKKTAIKNAVSKAKGALIITTDADCRVSNDWISLFGSYYEQYKPKIISGPVAINNTNNIFSRMQALEFISLVGSGAGAIGAGYPIMCNAANLCFEKEIFLDEVDNTKSHNYASGDDILLMLNIKKKYPNDIKFIKARNSIVYTQPLKSLKEYISQRKRWTSKSRAYSDIDIIFTAILVFFINASLLLCFIAMFFSYSFFILFLILFVSKSFPDFILLKKNCNFFQSRKLLRVFIPLQLIYPFYITFTAIYGNIGKFIWKERKLK